jgi:hypothetical protein
MLSVIGAEMPRYFFNVADTHVVPDLEGAEFPDLEAAKDEAIAAARTILADGARAGLDRSAWTMVVSVEGGGVVLRVDFAAALRTDTLPAPALS